MLELWRDVSKHALITKGVSKTVRQLQKLTFSNSQRVVELDTEKQQGID